MGSYCMIEFSLSIKESNLNLTDEIFNRAEEILYNCGYRKEETNFFYGADSRDLNLCLSGDVTSMEEETAILGLKKLVSQYSDKILIFEIRSLDLEQDGDRITKL